METISAPHNALIGMLNQSEKMALPLNYQTQTVGYSIAQMEADRLSKERRLTQTIIEFNDRVQSQIKNVEGAVA